jgi:uncharacterized protein (TIGR02594 family)
VNGKVHLDRLRKVGRNVGKGFTISAPVGDWAKGAKNVPADVETVQLLLEYVSQKRGRKELNPKGVDGQISRVAGGSSTIKAIHAFQRTFMQRSDGLVEPEGTTLKKLRAVYEGSTSQTKSAAESVMKSPHPSDHLPPWLSAFNGVMLFSPLVLLPPAESAKPDWISAAEKELGEKEIAGDKHNSRILQYHATTSLKAKADETAWCAAFVNWVLEESGYDGKKSASSHAWKTWGDGLSKPAVGAVAFIDWGKVFPNKPKKQGKGHVGFVVGRTADNRIVLLGGNQGNEVKYAGFMESHIHAYRVPKGYRPGPNLYDLPIMEISEDGGGFTATR